MVERIVFVIGLALIDRLRVGAVLEVGIAVERVQKDNQVLDRVLDPQPQGG